MSVFADEMDAEIFEFVLAAVILARFDTVTAWFTQYTVPTSLERTVIVSAFFT